MKRVTHIDGVPVRRPFYTYPAMTAHEALGWRAMFSRWLRRLFTGD